MYLGQSSESVWYVIITASCIIMTGYLPFEKITEPSGGTDSVAKSLIEGLVDTATDPEYTERVAKSVVASMYLGEPISC